ncbi:uncharacterized protein BCR38DRAFT_400725 [Pseudomassariella vexata]|uniref:Uncharacterized protein n=1 Tax=Pseudomassariella vexata TaxID=1141098 RepID=A0A1Y2DG04_9PEZI|nr:uncharacterized protein BCR38DRAFT_400725 [Pseudomassariella vexata]ORY58212.1 hypothetical protein BCR38DRAFT_400725 [Pseudomassariella vexata]
MEFYKKFEDKNRVVHPQPPIPSTRQKYFCARTGTHVKCKLIYMLDVNTTIVHKRYGKHRMIITSQNKCKIISQVLVDDYFTSPSGKPRFRGLIYVVQFDDTGTRSVFTYENGFWQLAFRSQHGKYME